MHSQSGVGYIYLIYHSIHTNREDSDQYLPYNRLMIDTQ